MPAPQGHRCPVPPQVCLLSHCAGTWPPARRSMMCQGSVMCTPMAPFRSSRSPLPASANSSMTIPTIAQRRTPQGESGAKMFTLRLVSFSARHSVFHWVVTSQISKLLEQFMLRFGYRLVKSLNIYNKCCDILS